MAANRRKWIIAGVVVLLAGGAASLAWRWHRVRQEARAEIPSVVTVQLTGTPGGRFVGHYIRNGRHVPANGVLPATFTDSRVWSCEFRKTDPNQILTLEARDGNSYASITAAAGTPGVRANMKHGWNVGHITE